MLADNARVWPPGELPIVTVCKTDRRSAKAAAELLAAGLSQVSVLRGGTDAWRQQGLPLD